MKPENENHNRACDSIYPRCDECGGLLLPGSDLRSDKDDGLGWGERLDTPRRFVYGELCGGAYSVPGPEWKANQDSREDPKWFCAQPSTVMEFLSATLKFKEEFDHRYFHISHDFDLSDDDCGPA